MWAVSLSGAIVHISTWATTAMGSVLANAWVSFMNIFVQFRPVMVMIVIWVGILYGFPKVIAFMLSFKRWPSTSADEWSGNIDVRIWKKRRMWYNRIQDLRGTWIFQSDVSYKKGWNFRDINKL